MESMDSGRRVRSEFQAICANYVIEVVNNYRKNCASLTSVCTCAVQMREDVSYMIDVLFRCFADYDCIVKINDGEELFNAEKNHVHGSLDCAQCVPEFEW